MTEAEKQEIVGLVMTEISSQAVDFDITTEQPQANDLLTAVREVAGRYVGVTLKWDDVARIATELANQAATRAEQALSDTTATKTEVGNMKASVEQTVTDFNALAEEKKQEVQGVYQNDLDELKGDLADITKTKNGRNLFNKNSTNKKVGAYVNYSTGTIGAVDTYTAIVIPIDASRENLTWSVKGLHIAFFSFVPNLSDYSINQTIPNFISGTVTGNTIAIPTNAKAVIVSYPTSTEYVQVEYGSQQTIYQQYIECFLIDESKIENYSNKVSFVTGKNLFNKNTVNKAIGYYANGANGNCGQVSSYSIVGLEVSEGDILSFNLGSLHVCALRNYTDLSYITVDKLVGEYISGFSDSSRKQGWIVPNGCKYITVSYPTEKEDTLQIEKGSISTDYESYKIGIDGDIVFDKKAEVTVGISGCDYTSVLKALKETPPNIIVHITSGTYNIEQEYKDYYGENFWSNYDTYQGKSDMFYSGLWLAKGRKVYGDANTILDFSTYDGSNENVVANWSVIANSVDTELKNVTIKVNNNCRYSIHDDFEPMHGTITWERIIFEGQTRNVCIGAGIGVDVTYIIRDCIFNGNEYYNISYHGKNVDYATAPCRIYVTNCIGKSRLAFRWMGASTDVTKCYVSGCKFSQYICEAYNNEQPYENMELIAWGNS